MLWFFKHSFISSYVLQIQKWNNIWYGSHFIQLITLHIGLKYLTPPYQSPSLNVFFGIIFNTALNKSLISKRSHKLTIRADYIVHQPDNILYNVYLCFYFLFFCIAYFVQALNDLAFQSTSLLPVCTESGLVRQHGRHGNKILVCHINILVK
jgi:hypothetical protein